MSKKLIRSSLSAGFNQTFIKINYCSPNTINVLQNVNIIHKFKRPLGDCISNRINNIYVGHSTTTSSRRWSFHLNDASNVYNNMHVHIHSLEKKSR